jgi:hypothetical protein
MCHDENEKRGHYWIQDAKYLPLRCKTMTNALFGTANKLGVISVFCFVPVDITPHSLDYGTSPYLIYEKAADVETTSNLSPSTSTG